MVDFIGGNSALTSFQGNQDRRARRRREDTADARAEFDLMTDVRNAENAIARDAVVRAPLAGHADTTVAGLAGLEGGGTAARARADTLKTKDEDWEKLAIASYAAGDVATGNYLAGKVEGAPLNIPPHIRDNAQMTRAILLAYELGYDPARGVEFASSYATNGGNLEKTFAAVGPPAKKTDMTLLQGRVGERNVALMVDRANPNKDAIIIKTANGPVGAYEPPQRQFITGPEGNVNVVDLNAGTASQVQTSYETPRTLDMNGNMQPGRMVAKPLKERPKAATASNPAVTNASRLIEMAKKLAKSDPSSWRKDEFEVGGGDVMDSEGFARNLDRILRNLAQQNSIPLAYVGLAPQAPAAPLESITATGGDAAGTGNVPTVNTIEEYQALPPGTQYYDTQAPGQGPFTKIDPRNPDGATP